MNEDDDERKSRKERTMCVNDGQQKNVATKREKSTTLTMNYPTHSWWWLCKHTHSITVHFTLSLMYILFLLKANWFLREDPTSTLFIYAFNLNFLFAKNLKWMSERGRVKESMHEGFWRGKCIQDKSAQRAKKQSMKYILLTVFF